MDDLYRLLVENVRDYAIFVLDPDGVVSSWNLGAERIKGYTEEEITGKHYSVFYPPEALRQGIPQRQLEIAAAVGRFEGEGWRLRKDGTRFWAHVVITALWDDDGVLAGFGVGINPLDHHRVFDPFTQVDQSMTRRAGGSGLDGPHDAPSVRTAVP